MTLNELFKEIFPVPYNHSKWLFDQAILIGRLKASKDPYLKEQAKKLEGFQKADQCSVVMIDIVVDRVRKHLTTNGESAIISDSEKHEGELNENVI